MKNKFISLLISAIISISAISAIPIGSTSFAEDIDVLSPRQMERLDRGTVAVKTSGGVYLSWRFLGTENLTNQAFDIYRDGKRIHTTGAHDATCYTDAQGNDSSKYIVVPSGKSIDGEKAVTPWTTNVEYKNGGFSNSVAYKDISFTAPSGGTTPDGGEYTYSANDMSTGDLDGDGEYEIIVKWDPSNSQDNSKTGYTGEVYMDAYKLDGTRLWRMDLGKNIRAGAHYTQYLVYDFDGDGKSEIVFKTAPGSKDGKGNFVSQAGKLDNIKNADNTTDYRNGSGLVLEGPEWLTIFNGETGEAMDTVNYDPPRSINNDDEWGDGYGNRCERYLAGVAYLDGVHPSAIMTRGYYTYAYAAAYSWDGTNLKEQWLSSNTPINGSTGGCTVKYADGTTKHQADKTLYGQGAHSVSVADVDNDGFDELIFGSAVLDNDGTVLIYDGRGHGDAEHVSDFDNDGRQEIFFVHEAGKGSDATIPFAVDIKRNDGDVMLQAAVGDIGRGAMANIDDEYAVSSGNLSAFWSVASSSLFNQKGEAIGNIPYSNSNYENFFIYWDGDLGRELLDGTKLAKHSILNNSTTRIYYNNKNSTFPNVSDNNGSKANPGLVADILGDWREEVIYPLWDGTGMRIYFSTIPTDYRLTTLMHDSQYRCAVAWQNVGYNQPPHTSYYIGSAALAKSGSNNLNYLAPATAFDEITYPNETEKTPPPVEIPDSKPNIKEVTPQADTYIVNNDTTTAHGADSELKINQATDMYANATPGLKEPKGLGFIRFDLSDYADKEIQSAELRLFTKYTNSDNVTSLLCLDYCSKDDWDEATLTADGITVRGKGTPLSSLGLTQTPKFSKEYEEVVFDVTNALKADSDNVHTFTLWTKTAREQIIASKEYIGTDAKAPTLVLTLKPSEFTGIELTLPEKTEYIEGEELDLTGMVVKAVYDDGSTIDMSSDYEVTGYDKTKTGKQIITVSYKGKTATFEVTVKSKTPVITATGIQITPPEKTVYKEGEELDTAGMTVMELYSNGTSESVNLSDCIITGYDKTKIGTQTVTVSYGEWKAEFEVTVEARAIYDNVVYDSDNNLAVIQLTSGRKACVIFAAFDEDGILTSISVKDNQELSAGTTEIAPQETFKKTDNVKIFVWDSLRSMNPILASH